MEKKKYIYLFSFLSYLQLISSVSIGDFQSNFNIALNLQYKFESLIKQFNGEDPGEGDVFGDRTIGLLEKSITKIDNVSSALNIMNEHMVQKFESLHKLIIDLDEAQTKSALMRRFADCVDRIHAVYDELLDFSDKKKEITKKRIERFVDDNIKSKNTESIEGQLQQLQSTLISDTNSENLLWVMEKTERKRFDEDLCGRTTAHIILYQFYLTVAGIELLGLATLSTGYALNELLHPDEKAAKELLYIFEKYEIRIAKYAQKFSDTLKRLSRNVINCDPGPGNYVRDGNFVEMWGAMQLVAHPEYKLEDDQGVCKRWPCSEYSNYLVGNNQRCYANDRRWSEWNADGTPVDMEFCLAARKCMGKLRGCWATESLDQCSMRNGTRRYEWLFIHSEPNGVLSKHVNSQYGPKTDCKEGVYQKREHFSVSWSSCFYCLCWCEDNTPQSNSVHLFNLQPVRVNTAKNRILIGARFVVFENILHIQVKQGLILPGYYVPQKKTKWVKLQSLKDDIYKSRTEPNNAKLKENEDFSVLTDRQAFDINGLEFPNNRLITGLKFGKVKGYSRHNNDRIQLQVETMEYDYKSGNLKQGSEEWTKPEPNRGTEFKTNHDNPVKSKNRVKIDAKPGQYVVLQSTDLYTDAAQTMIPLFDAQPIETIPTAPLTGIGLSHRGNSDGGGFFVLTAQTMNYGDFLYDTYEPYKKTIEDKMKKSDRAKNKNDKNYDDNDDDDDDDDDDAGF